MDLGQLTQIGDYAWRIDAHGAMRVPVVLYGDRDLISAMDDKVFKQAVNVTTLPGIVEACYTMPDAHWGYGFPIGGVAAFDVDRGGVVSAGGVGFDISCGVRTLHTGLSRSQIESVKSELADALYRDIPVGVGSTGRIELDDDGMDAMLTGGAQWAVAQGYGRDADLHRIEEHGCMQDADPAAVSRRAKQRQRREMGTLGSGNHYLEIQEVVEIFDVETAKVFGLAVGDVVISIHCGSRGLGHQIGTEFLRDMVTSAEHFGIDLPDPELACAPIQSSLGQRYLAAMRCGINCALANRQIIMHLTQRVFGRLFTDAELPLLYDVSHNTCKVERHRLNGRDTALYVHRKGATRAFGPGHPDLPEAFSAVGQPVLIGGSMGTASYVLAGNSGGAELSFSSACHGAGRGMSRHQARRRWSGRQVTDDLAKQHIVVRSPSMRGVAEEAPGAYKDVHAVVDATHNAGLARKIAKLRPLVCIKG
ncbi:MAG: RtcB family protein [Gammaproteobacteria bacterium]|nr:RtcB family protein [Gammaproteobacteria bacterium]